MVVILNVFHVSWKYVDSPCVTKPTNARKNNHWSIDWEAFSWVGIPRGKGKGDKFQDVSENNRKIIQWQLGFHKQSMRWLQMIDDWYSQSLRKMGMIHVWNNRFIIRLSSHLNENSTISLCNILQLSLFQSSKLAFRRKLQSSNYLVHLGVPIIINCELKVNAWCRIASLLRLWRWLVDRAISWFLTFQRRGKGNWENVL